LFFIHPVDEPVNEKGGLYGAPKSNYGMEQWRGNLIISAGPGRSNTGPLVFRAAGFEPLDLGRGNA
jgi:hypothetical protein